MKSDPIISIVSPSFNQAPFIEDTIRSVLDQNYPKLEYVIIDGGSTDGSLDVIQRYAPELTAWVSEPDKGQYDAINKGFSRTSGEIMSWINTDDKFFPWTFHTVATLFSRFPEIEWLTASHQTFLDENGLLVGCSNERLFSTQGFFRGEHLPGGDWFATGFIQQEATFWRRSLWERTGARVDDSLSLAGDFELWARFFKAADLYCIGIPLGCFRYQPKQKSAIQRAQYIEEASSVLLKHGGQPPGPFKSLIRKYSHRLPQRLKESKKLAPILRTFAILYPCKKCRWLDAKEGWSTFDSIL